MNKNAFLSEIRAGIRANQHWVETALPSLEPDALRQRPSARDWSVLECIEHLRLTHAYYRSRIEPALAGFVSAPGAAEDDRYQPSLMGRIYMRFAFNPRLRFPAPRPVVPAEQPDPSILAAYLVDLDRLRDIVDQAESADLRKTRVRIQRGTYFNLGDCLKVLVHHDALHLDQARRALETLAASADRGSRPGLHHRPRE